jgi:hypothetical protein
MPITHYTPQDERYTDLGAVTRVQLIYDDRVRRRRSRRARGVLLGPWSVQARSATT